MSGARLLYAYEGRSDYAREEPVIRRLSATAPAEQWLVCARSRGSDPRASYFGGREIPARIVHLGIDTGSPDFRLGRLLIGMGDLIARLDPGAVVTAGGSDAALAAALAAARNGVPAFRIDGGVRGELAPRIRAARRIADVLADLLFVRDERAFSVLREEGVPADRIRRTADPIEDFLRERFGEEVDGPPQGPPDEASAGEPGHVLACLRAESVSRPESELGALWERLREVAAGSGAVILVPLEPGLAELVRDAGGSWGPGIRPIHAPDFADLVQLIRRARLVVSDCDEVSEEAELLGVPRLRLSELLERSDHSIPIGEAGERSRPVPGIAGAGAIALALVETLRAAAPSA